MWRRSGGAVFPPAKQTKTRQHHPDGRRQRNVHREVQLVELDVAFVAFAEVSKIDKAVKRGVLHKNAGARRKSQLSRAFKAVEGTPESA